MAADPAADRGGEHRLGILFVHGIGTQPPRETLVRWGDALIGVLAEMTRPLGAGDLTPEGAGMPLLTVEVTRACAGNGTADVPAELSLVLTPAGGVPETWLLRECWWADAFPPPTYREFVSWSAQAVPWSIALHIVQRYWQRMGQGGEGWRFGAAVLVTARLLAALALSPLIVAALAVMLLLGLLPVPQLRSLMLAAQSTLTATVGDSLAFVKSPVRAALIRSRVADALERLRKRCERMIVVAHSQGAAVVHEALGGIVPVGGEVIVPPPATAPDTLLTFGAGINKLVALKAAPRAAREPNPMSWALFLLLFTALLVARATLAVLRGEIPAGKLLLSFALWAVFLFVLGVLIRAVGPLERKLKGKYPRAPNVLRWAVAISSLAALAGLFLLTERLQLPWLPLWLILTYEVLAGALRQVVGKDMRTLITEHVRKPPAVTRWVDLYAEADPVPNGPILAGEAAGHESVSLWNEGSVLGDHTSYWSNRDDFVVRVVRECAATAESPWWDLLPAPGGTSDDAVPPARRRVGYLRRARMLNRLAWLAVLALVWKGAGALLPQPFELPAALPVWTGTAVRFALLVVAVTAAAFVTSRMLRYTWLLWARAEQRRCLARSLLPATLGATIATVTSMGLVLALPLLITQLLHQADRRGGMLEALVAGFSPFDGWVWNELGPGGGMIRFCGYGVMLALVLWAGDAIGRCWRRHRATSALASAAPTEVEKGAATAREEP